MNLTKQRKDFLQKRKEDLLKRETFLNTRYDQKNERTTITLKENIDQDYDNLESLDTYLGSLALTEKDIKRILWRISSIHKIDKRFIKKEKQFYIDRTCYEYDDIIYKGKK
jgi:hypothetical protein